MQHLYIRYFLIFLVLAGSVSCGRDADISRIREMESRFFAEKDPGQKSSLANMLHKVYSLYHLKNDSDTTFLLNWAGMALAGGEFEQARFVLSRFLELDENDPKVFASRGLVNARLGYYKEAGEDYSKAFLLSGGNTALAAGYEELSVFYLYCDSVISDCGKKIALEKDINPNKLRRAGVFMESKHFAGARADIDGVLREDPDNKDGWILLARLGLSADDPVISDSALNRYFSIAGRNDGRYEEAMKLRNEADAMLALQRLDIQLQKTPNDYTLLIEAGSAAFLLEDYQAAMIYCNRLTEVYPDSIFGYLYRGQIGIQTGRFGDALSDFARVVELDPDNISARNLRAYIYLLMKDEKRLREEIDVITEKGGELFEILKPFKLENS